MKSKTKKFLLSLVFSSIFSVLIYFILKQYDQTGNINQIIQKNLYYLIFLFISIVFGLTYYQNKDGKSKTILGTIFIANFIYLVFLFITKNIGLNQNEGIFLIGFLILGLSANFIKNRFGNIITTISVIGIVVIIYISIVPLYENGPNIKGFEKDLTNKIITYSTQNLDKGDALFQQDKNEYIFTKGLKINELKIQTGSQIIFKSSKLYQNTFGYLFLNNKEFIQIYPQSAIKIDENYNIKIVTGIVKYYPQNLDKFQFTGKFIPSLVVNQEQINILYDRYQQELKTYLINNLGGDLYKNTTILNISEKTLKILNTIFPNKYSKNLENLEKYKELINTQEENTENYKDIVKTEDIQKGFFKRLIDSFSLTQTLK